MIFKENYIYAGKILKTHGYQGDLVVLLENFTESNFKKKEPVFLEIDGIYVPFFIRSLSSLHDEKIVLGLDGIEKDYDAEEFTGLNVFLPEKKVKKRKSNELLNLQGFVGFNIMDKDKNVEGKVVEVYEIPGNPLLKIDILNQEILIPFHPDLVVKTILKENLLIMNIPEGLLNTQ